MNRSKPATVEKLTRRTLLCGEGLVWNAAAAKLYYTESSGQAVYCFDPARKKNVLHSRAVAATSLCLHRAGGLLACGRDGLAHLQPDGDVRPLAFAAAGGVAVDRLNEIVADPRGRVFAGQNVFAPDAPYAPGYLFRVDARGAHVCADDVHQGNGMDFSPDLRSFYFTDTIRRSVFRFDYDATSGGLKNRRLFFCFAADEGLPDGLKVDADGHVWVALFYGSCLVRIDPDGKPERRIPLPISQPTSLAFGGADLDEIYLTSESTFTPSDLAPAALDRKTPRGGQLFRVRQEVRGKFPFFATL